MWTNWENDGLKRLDQIPLFSYLSTCGWTIWSEFFGFFRRKNQIIENKTLKIKRCLCIKRTFITIWKNELKHQTNQINSKEKLITNHFSLIPFQFFYQFFFRWILQIFFLLRSRSQHKLISLNVFGRLINKI